MPARGEIVPFAEYIVTKTNAADVPMSRANAIHLDIWQKKFFQTEIA